MQGCKMFYIYSDLSYKLAYRIILLYSNPYGRRYLPQGKQRFNKVLSRVQIVVENAFGMVQQLWTYIAFGKALSTSK